jgi:hypothetical protein
LRRYREDRERVAVAAYESGRCFPYPVAVKAVAGDDDEEEFDSHVTVFMSDGRKLKVVDMDSLSLGEAAPHSFSSVVPRRNQQNFRSIHGGRLEAGEDDSSRFFSRVFSMASSSGISYPVPSSCFTMSSDVGYPGHVTVNMSDGTFYAVPDLDCFVGADRILAPSLGPLLATWSTDPPRTRAVPHGRGGRGAGAAALPAGAVVLPGGAIHVRGAALYYVRGGRRFVRAVHHGRGSGEVVQPPPGPNDPAVQQQ